MLKKTSFFILFLAVSFFLFNRLFFFKPGLLENTVAVITYPVLWATKTIVTPIKNFTLRQRTYEQIVKENFTLEIECKKLKQENVKLKALLQYDSMSTELRAFAQRYELENAILATVLTRTIAPDEHSLVINRGIRDGVEPNMIAVHEHQLIGRVSDVYPFHSKIQLITDSQSKVAAHTTEHRAAGIVQGTNNPKYCEFKYVSHLSPVEPEDLVFSSGQGLVFPQGFCLGTISSVKTSKVCHEIVVTPLIDLKTLEMCLLTNQSKMNIF